ncbi:hypothetical protein SISSUDRAFT_394399 [Sistotremastrum suecicum HHB10207 ss-3]|uniref:DhaK domain-containing protein n=1 Tax=Sistotremastrum suecicum HHB10207 ss-3 TaxID=1314776 RepID=A0A165YW64_9AGAM|nr:hypothetical protein SISSUDRAFT_394399 [Sistotremastrum suecicum HHB10207 ss-3]
MISTSKKPVSDDLNNIQSYKSLLLSSLRSSTFLNPTLNLHSPSSTLYVSPSLTSLATCAVIGVSCSTSSVGSYAGFTGLGMLRASTFGQSDSGNIDADQVERAIKLGCAGREECLVIVDGGCTDEDLLRIAIGMERVRDELGLRIDWVLPCRILEGPAAAAANLLCKIIGAAAERGLPLSILAPLGKVVSNSLDVITHFGPPISDVANPTEDNSSLATTSSISTLVSSLLSSLLTSQSRNPIPFLQNVDGVEEKETALVITHFGGISSLEVGSIVDHVVRQLSEHDIHPSRLYSIPSSASESRGGFSIALLNISHAHYLFRAALLQASQSQSSSALPTGHGEDDDEYAFEEWLESLHVPDILTLLDDPTGTQCWSSNGTSPYSTSHSNPSANSGSASSAIRNVGWTWPRNPKRAKGEKENDEEFSAKVIFGASMASSRRNTGVGVHSSEIEAD